MSRRTNVASSGGRSLAEREVNPAECVTDDPIVVSRLARLRGAVDPSLAVLRLVEELRSVDSPEGLLQAVTDSAATLLGVARASLRLLDESRARLLVAARTGTALHTNGGADFAVGEGFVGWVVEQGIALRVGDAEMDPRFVAKPGKAERLASFLGVPLLDARGCIGVLAVTSPDRRAFSLVDERWLRAVAGMATPYLEVLRLERLAMTDPLTIALNRRALEDLLPMAPDGDEPTSVITIDLDGFKALNDKLGHAAGDEALRGVAPVADAVRCMFDGSAGVGVVPPDVLSDFQPGEQGSIDAIVFSSGFASAGDWMPVVQVSDHFYFNSNITYQ